MTKKFDDVLYDDDDETIEAPILFSAHGGRLDKMTRLIFSTLVPPTVRLPIPPCNPPVLLTPVHNPWRRRKL